MRWNGIDGAIGYNTAFAYTSVDMLVAAIDKSREALATERDIIEARTQIRLKGEAENETNDNS